MTTAWRLVTFVVGTALLVGLSSTGADPLWTPWSSLVSAVAAYFTAPRVIDALLRRRVSWRTAGLWYIGVAAPFDLAQLVTFHTWHPGWAAANAAGASVLFLALGLVRHAADDLRRYWLPAGAAATVGGLALLAWSWP
jgi:hypothetical protein